MPTAPPSITTLPAAPDPNNRTTFNSLAYPWSAALPTFGTQVSAVATNVKANADEAEADAVATAADRVVTTADRVVTTADRVAAEASAATATTGASTATAQASIATTKAGEANASAIAAAASVASIAGGPVASVNGMTGVVTGVATLTDTQTLTNKTLTAPAVNGATLTGFTETVYSLAGTDIAVANGTIQTKTLAANTTFTESLADGQSVMLGITAGAYSVTWPSTTWAKVGGSGVAPTLTSTGVNWVILWQTGGTLRGAFLGTT